MVKVRPVKTTSDKIFEKIPPILTWFVIIFPIVGSFFVPELVAIFVLTFDVFFLYRSISFTVQFILGLILLRAAEQVNWFAKVEGLEDIDGEISKLQDSINEINNADFATFNNGNGHTYAKYVGSLPTALQKMIFFWEKAKTKRYINSSIRELKSIKQEVNDDELTLISYKEINHVVVIPHAKEPLEVLDKTLARISESSFPRKQIHIMLGAEERDPEGYDKSVILQKKYGNVFGNIWISKHVLKEHELIGKSSNMAAAGKLAVEKIRELEWDLKKTTVTSCDADSQIPVEYFSYLTYKFITTKDAEYKFYTGAILMYANIWRIDFLARVRNSLSSIYNVGKLVRPDKFVPFSTYSTSFWLVEQAGYWTPWVTPEDFHIFFKSSFTFPDKVSTIPMFIKIMVDAAEGDNMIDSFRNNYYQSRRWQWGVSDDGWVLKNLVYKFGKLPFIVYYRGLHVMIDHILAPSSSFLIMLGANLPPFLNEEFGGTVFGAKLSNMSSFLIRLTLASFIIAIVFDVFLKPKQDGVSIFRRLITPVEWIFNPVVGLFLTSVPGLEAHTRLLFGKYLEYYITKKKA